LIGLLVVQPKATQVLVCYQTRTAAIDHRSLEEIQFKLSQTATFLAFLQENCFEFPSFAVVAAVLSSHVETFDSKDQFPL